MDTSPIRIGGIVSPKILAFHEEYTNTTTSKIILFIAMDYIHLLTMFVRYLLSKKDSLWLFLTNTKMHTFCEIYIFRVVWTKYTYQYHQICHNTFFLYDFYCGIKLAFVL